MGWILGVDAGGSKCAAVAIDASAAERGRALAGPGNPNGVGFEVAAREIWSSCAAALAAAGGGAVERIGVGFAGGGSPRARATLARELAALAPGLPLFLCSDLECALEGAFGGTAGILVVAGTGSSALGGDGAGRTQRAGGYGPRLGDEGSGYWIAKRALALALAAPPSEGARSLAFFRERFEVEADLDLPSAFHRAADRPAEIAALTAPLIERCGAEPLLSRVLDEAAEHLAALALRCASALELAVPQVACVGGLLGTSSPLRARFARALVAVLPGAVMRDPARSPEWGAAQLARKAAF
ncbi:MAG: hypothetical protein JNM84_09140 [Planctomycetes bacterium]|nr:hypothetical protein [Planctomycetota bacterium]